MSSLSLKIGDVAPDFRLQDQNRVYRNLSDYKGEKQVILVFFPLPFTGVCQSELDFLRDHEYDFNNEDTQLLAITVAAAPVNKVWSSYQGYLFPVLADFWPHGQVAQEYGVFSQETGVSGRGTIVVDRDGVIMLYDVQVPNYHRDQSLWDNVKKTLKS